jgi:DNA polymerase-3 subunit gamma/tau
VGYQTLYRKYRSLTFSEIVGQEHVLFVLRGALARNRIAHAYLFSGPRGTGKTSVARIFAKALNCPNVKGGEPCGTCHVCTSITEGRSPDVIEMDAASNRGVENIEELRRAVQFVPQEFKYKVYIIDEVHMISPHGFNALLKTLEEPPSHAVFILATTEPQKLPITILSRCLRFEFRRIPYEKLAAHVKFITEAENHRIADDAAVFLAELSEGSARDAISLLDQLIIASDSEITIELVRSLFGLTHPEAITRMVELLVNNDLAGLTSALHEFIVQGHDPEQLLRLFYEKLRDGYLGVVDDEKLASLVLHVPQQKLVLCIEALWDAFSTLRHTNHPLGLVELTLFKLAALIHAESVAKAAQPAFAQTYAPLPPREPPAAQERRPEPRDDRAETATTAPAAHDAPPTTSAPNSRYSPRGKPKTLSVNPSELLEETRKDLLSGAQKGKVTELNETEGDDHALGGNRPPFRDKAVPDTVPSSEYDAGADDFAIPVDYGEPVDWVNESPAVHGVHSDTRKAKPIGEAAIKPKPLPSLPPSMPQLPLEIWTEALKRLKNEYFTTYCLVREELNVIPIKLSSNVLYLAYGQGDLLIRNFALGDRHRRAVQAILKEITGENYEIVFDPSEAKLEGLGNAELAEIREAQIRMLF